MGKQQQSRGRAQRRAWAEKDWRRREIQRDWSREWPSYTARKHGSLEMEMDGSYDKEAPDFVRKETKPFVSHDGVKVIFAANVRGSLDEQKEETVTVASFAVFESHNGVAHAV